MSINSFPSAILFDYITNFPDVNANEDNDDEDEDPDINWVSDEVSLMSSFNCCFIQTQLIHFLGCLPGVLGWDCPKPRKSISSIRFYAYAVDACFPLAMESKEPSLISSTFSTCDQCAHSVRSPLRNAIGNCAARWRFLKARVVAR